MMEGISSEAASFAGHQQLGKLIMFYDDNHITIDGSTDLAFTEDVCKRFEAYGWHVQRVADGNDVEAIDAAITAAKAETGKPSLHRRAHAHRLRLAQQAGQGRGARRAARRRRGQADQGGLRLAARPRVLRARRRARGVLSRPARRPPRRTPSGRERYEAWRAADAARAQSRGTTPGRARCPRAGTPTCPSSSPDDKVATRAASGKVINAVAPHIPTLMGGSADLAPSNNTLIKDAPDQQAATPDGRNVHCGVRELAMAAMANGLSTHGGIRPYVATFFVFVDYMRPAMRLSALMGQPVIYVLTHDSIGVGEDGPTHQPIEHLAMLRATPGFVDLRPADANETVEAWKIALQTTDAPVGLMLTRQNLPDHRPREVRAGERHRPRRLRAGRRLRRRRAGRDPHRQRQRGRPRARGARAPRGRGRALAARQHGVHAALRAAGRRLPRERAAGRLQRPRRRRGRRHASAGTAGSATAARSSASTTSAPRRRPARSSRSSASRRTTSTRAPRRSPAPTWPASATDTGGGADRRLERMERPREGPRTASPFGASQAQKP